MFIFKMEKKRLYMIQKQQPEMFCKKRCKKSPEACNFVKKETLAQIFSCEFCEVFRNTFFTEHLWTTASYDTI